MFCYIAVYLAHSSLNIFFFFFSSQMEFPFVDDSFPPCNKSLTFNGTACPKVHRWLRPEDIGGPSTLWKVFSNPQPSDIIQGSLGDCWWVIVSFFVWLCGNVKLYWWMIASDFVCFCFVRVRSSLWHPWKSLVSILTDDYPLSQWAD